jgi:hypothetical protein
VGCWDGAEVFSPWQFSGVQWHSVTTVTSYGYLACTTAQPALRAVVRCSQVPRWGQTKEMYFYYYFVLGRWV